MGKLKIALREAYETRYWLPLLYGGKYMSQEPFQLYLKDCEEIIRLPVSIVKKVNE